MSKLQSYDEIIKNLEHAKYLVNYLEIQGIKEKIDNAINFIKIKKAEFEKQNRD